MRIIKETHFDNFICAADKCSDTCCQGWQIILDDEALKRFEGYEGPYRKELTEAVTFDGEDHLICFASNGKCPLLNEKGLCNLVLTEGEEFISEICHMYPRHVEEFDGIREWSLSISCPHAAKTLLLEETPLTYDAVDNDDEEELYEDFEDFDTLLYTKLEDSREVIFNILKDRSISIFLRLKLILSLGRKLQEKLDVNELFDMDDIIDEYSSGYKDMDIVSSGDPSEVFLSFMKEIKDNFDIMLRLEKLRNEWNYVLSDTLKLSELKEEEYQKLCIDFLSSFNDCNIEIVLENLIYTYIFTYYLGAVYDDCLYAKLSFSVYSVFMMVHIFLSKMDQGLINISADDFIDVVYRFARETEHSDINLNTLEEECEKLFA